MLFFSSEKGSNSQLHSSDFNHRIKFLERYLENPIGPIGALYGSPLPLQIFSQLGHWIEKNGFPVGKVEF